MTKRRLYPVWVTLLALSCSSSGGGDLFDEPVATDAAPATGGTTSDSESTTATASTDSDTSTTDVAESSGGAASTSSTDFATSSSTASTSGGTSSGGTSSGGTSSGGTSSEGSSGGTSSSNTDGAGGTTSAGETASTTGASTTGSGEPIVETIEYMDDEDCVELQCPEQAPHLVGCNITFTSFNDEYFCVALEPERVVFLKSGDSCDGSLIAEGSSITCSSEPLPAELSAAECHSNKEQLDVVSDRCDCEAASEIDECGARG